MNLADIKLGHHYRYDSTFAGSSRMEVAGFGKQTDNEGHEHDVVLVYFQKPFYNGQIPIHPDHFVELWNPKPYPFEKGQRVHHTRQWAGTITDIGEGHWDAYVTVDFDNLGEAQVRPDEIEVIE